MSELFTSSIYFPWASVAVPKCVPLIMIDTPGKGSPSFLSVTTPVKVRVWALLTCMQMINRRDKKPINFLIVVCLVYKKIRFATFL